MMTLRHHQRMIPLSLTHDGNDTILDSQGTDTIKFGEGITAENTIFTGLDQDNAMIITFTNSDDSILIKMQL